MAPTLSTVVHDPKGDIHLKSADGVLFLVQKVQLQGNSQVFKERFDTCVSSRMKYEDKPWEVSDETADEKPQGGPVPTVEEKLEKLEKPVVVLAETGEKLEGFLVFLVSGSKRPSTLNLDSCAKYVINASDTIHFVCLDSSIGCVRFLSIVGS